MRPIFIIFSNLGLGGIQKKIVDIVNFLAEHRKSLPIFILLRRKDVFDISYRIKNKKVKIINYQDWTRIETPIFFPFFVLYQTWRLKPRAILSFISPFSLPAILAKLVFFWQKIRVVVSENHYTSGRLGYLRHSKILSLGIKILYPFADSIISFTQACKKDLVKSFGIPEEKVKVVSNWTNFANRKILKSDEKYDLIFIGRLTKNKKVDFLLKRLVELKKYKKNVKLCLVGDGEERRNLETLVAKKDIIDNVNFVGAKYEVENFLAKSKLFVYSPQSRGEGFPSAILEAMALGAPVLTSNFAGAKEIIKDGENGFIFNSMDEFIQKTLLLLKCSSKRKSVTQKAKAHVKKNHSLRNIKIYLDALGIN